MKKCRKRILRTEKVVDTSWFDELYADMYPIVLASFVQEKPQRVRINAKAYAFYRKWGESPLVGYISHRKVHRFLERILPRNHYELDSLLYFLRKKKHSRMSNLRYYRRYYKNNSATAGDVALSVA